MGLPLAYSTMYNVIVSSIITYGAVAWVNRTKLIITKRSLDKMHLPNKKNKIIPDGSYSGHARPHSLIVVEKPKKGYSCEWQRLA